MDLSLIYNWVNFIVFFGLLIYFLKEPLLDFLGDRRETLRREMESVSHLKKEMEMKLKSCQAKLTKIDSEIEQLMLQLEQEGKREKQVLIQKAEEFVARMREDTKRVGEQELKRVERELKQNGVRIALGIAKESLKRTIASKDQTRLLLWGMEHLQGSNR